jgi:hypothetical protein
MRGRSARGVLLTVAVALISMGAAGSTSQAAPGEEPFEVFHSPPGLLLRGEHVTLQVQTDAARANATAYVRSEPQGSFTSLPLSPDPSADFVAKVPAALLSGSILEDYVVVHDPDRGETLTVPPQGAEAPFRSWIVDDPPTVPLSKHRFGHIREPDAILAQAKPGSGRGEVGFTCPPEGLCETPWSFDIGADGSVWVTDTANQRLVGWTPGHPDKPTRTIPLSFGAADLAIGPDGTIYVSGSKPGVGMRLFAFTPDGKHLWTGPLLSQIFNQHIRFGGDGILYGAEGQTGWAPAVGADGRPISLAEQRLGARAYQPVSAKSQLVVSAPWRVPPHHVAPTDWRVALTTTDSGHLQQVWRIVSADDISPSFQATSAVVDGDPVIVFEVYDLANHLMEYDQLSPSGEVALRFSLGPGSDGAATTDVRVGPDHAIYQLQNDPKLGLKIARYPLLRAQTPSPTPTTSATPTVTISTPTTAPSSGTTRPVVGLAIAAAVVLVVALGGALWMRRRSPTRRRQAGG